MTYDYHINLDERGEFNADLRDANGETIYIVATDDDGLIPAVEDGYMKHGRDTDGLEAYLKELGFIEPDDTIFYFG